MAQRYDLPLTLTILGPLLTAATGAGTYGYDKAFHRDYQGNLVIPASHLKGKLRMALKELAPFFGPATLLDLSDWFGVGSDEGQDEG